MKQLHKPFLTLLENQKMDSLTANLEVLNGIAIATQSSIKITSYTWINTVLEQ